MLGELAPLLHVEVVHPRPQFGLLAPFVPEELAHRRPVLRFAGRVVVLAAGPAAGAGPLPFPSGQGLMQCPVEELRPVVGVEALHLKWRLCFECLQLAEDGLAAFVPARTVFRSRR